MSDWRAFVVHDERSAFRAFPFADGEDPRRVAAAEAEAFRLAIEKWTGPLSVTEGRVSLGGPVKP